MDQEIVQREVRKLREHALASLVPEMSTAEWADLLVSIEREGIREGLRVTPGGIVLDGRHRLRAARHLKLERVPCLVIRLRGEEARIQYMVEASLTRRHLSASQKAAIVVDLDAHKEEQAAAKARKRAGGRKGGRAKKKKDLARPPEARRKTGANSRELLGKRYGVGGRTIQDAIKVSRTAPDLHARVKAGEISLGEALRLLRQRSREEEIVVAPPAAKSPKLYVGDATDLHMIEDDSVDLVCTSPPYNIGIEQGRVASKKAKRMGDSPVRTGIAWRGVDYEKRVPEPEFRAFMLKALAEMFRVLKPGGSLLLHQKVRTIDNKIIHPITMLNETEFTIRQEIVIDKISSHNNNAKLFVPVDERLYWLVKGVRPNLPDRPIRLPTVWRLPQRGPTSWHPAPFISAIPRRCLESLGFPGAVVLDPFGGSMVVPRVALEMGFEAIGVEIREEYVKRASRENGWATATPARQS